MPHSAVVHDQQDDIRFRSTNLKTETTTFHADSGGGAPTRAIVLPARGETTTIFRADNKPGLLHPRHDDHAMGLIEQILRDTLIGSMHHIDDRIGRGV